MSTESWSQGKVRFRRTTTPLLLKEVRIDLSNLPSSVYFLKISYIDAESIGLPGTVTRKILVK